MNLPVWTCFSGSMEKEGDEVHVLCFHYFECHDSWWPWVVWDHDKTLLPLPPLTHPYYFESPHPTLPLPSHSMNLISIALEKMDLLHSMEVCWQYCRNVGKSNLHSFVQSIVWECLPWFGNIQEILWKYCGNKTSILWKRSRFFSAAGVPNPDESWYSQ